MFRAGTKTIGNENNTWALIKRDSQAHNSWEICTKTNNVDRFYKVSTFLIGNHFTNLVPYLLCPNVLVESYVLLHILFWIHVCFVAPSVSHWTYVKKHIGPLFNPRPANHHQLFCNTYCISIIINELLLSVVFVWQNYYMSDWLVLVKYFID